MKNIKYVQVEIARGKEFYYFRRGRGKRIRLPDPASPEFKGAYDAAMLGKERTKAERSISIQRAYQISVAIRRGVARARDASAKSGVEFDLTADWALRKVRDQEFKCALTGVAFFDDHETKSRRHPYAPSIDRIEAGGSYTMDNCRIVTHAANIMLFDWGESVFKKSASGYLESR